VVHPKRNNEFLRQEKCNSSAATAWCHAHEMKNSKTKLKEVLPPTVASWKLNGVCDKLEIWAKFDFKSESKFKYAMRFLLLYILIPRECSIFHEAKPKQGFTSIAFTQPIEDT
jgi:hypothetical protein